MNKTEEALTGRTITKAEVDGYGITLELDDGKTFFYDASDGGYSMWEVCEDGESDERFNQQEIYPRCTDRKNIKSKCGG